MKYIYCKKNFDFILPFFSFRFAFSDCFVGLDPDILPVICLFIILP